MARRELRELAGAAGAKTSVEAAKPKKRAGDRNLNNADVQAEILHPADLRFKLKVDGVKKTLIVPLEFSIKDINERRILEDIDVFARLVYLELNKISPGADVAEVLRETPGYLELAMARSNVRSMLYELLVRVSYFDGDGPRVHPTFEQIESLANLDYFVCALRLYTQAIRRRTDAKNPPRPAPPATAQA